MMNQPYQNPAVPPAQYGAPTYPVQQGYPPQTTYAPVQNPYYPPAQQPTYPPTQYPQNPYPLTQSAPISNPHEVAPWLQQGNNYSQEEMWKWFSYADTNRNGAISSSELQAALDAAGQHYPMDAIVAMIDMFDADGSKDIDFQEFAGLYSYLQHMNAAFQQNSQGGLIDESAAEQTLYSHPGIAANADRGLPLVGVLTGKKKAGKMDYFAFLLLALAAGKVLNSRYKKGHHSTGHHSQHGHSQSYPSPYGQQQGYGYQQPYDQHGGQPNLKQMGTQILGSLFGKHR